MTLYGEPEYDENGYIITKENIKAGNENLLLKYNKLLFPFPLRLIHGDKDKAVSWKESLKIFNKSNNSDTELILIKKGDHSLSDAKSLNLIKSQLSKIIKNIF